MTNWQCVDAGWDSVAYTSSHPDTIKYFENVFSDYAIQAEAEGWNLKQKGTGSTKTFQVRKGMYTIYPNGRHRLSLTGSDAALLTGGRTPSHSRCTRCDLQMTLKADPSIPTIISQEYLRLRRSLSKTRRKTYLGIIDSTKGRTLYYGSSRNGNMGRVYDKGQQLKTEPPGTLIRWEVEWTKKASDQLLKQGRMLESNPLTLSEWVTAWFRKREFDVPQFGQSTSIALQVAREASDTETQLKWLTDQVQPVLRSLASKGKLQAALEALGLPPLE